MDVNTNRPNKGNSLLSFPDEYIVIDIETTGLSTKWDEIIEIAAIKYSHSQEVSRFETLVNPECEISEFISELTGITNEMVADAPDIGTVLKELVPFIGNDILVGHNVNFDINFLYDYANKYLKKSITNNYIDTMRIGRRALPNLEHHRQKDLAEYFGIDNSVSHRSAADCIVCNKIFQMLKDHILANNIDIAPKKRNYSGRVKVTAKEITTENTEFDETHPIYNKVCVFTGTLEKMSRKDAMQIVADLGGIPGDGVSQKTNFLILGNNDYCKSIKDGKSSKHKKAEKYALQGFDIEIIPEQTFYDMVFDN